MKFIVIALSVLVVISWVLTALFFYRNTQVQAKVDALALAANTVKKRSEVLLNESSITKLDDSKKVKSTINGSILEFHLEGSELTHQLSLPEGLTYKSTQSGLSSGVDYRISFTNGMVINITRTPSVVHYANRAYDYVETSLWEYSYERIPTVMTTTITDTEIFTEVLNKDIPGNFDSYRYFGFKLLPQPGPQQNILISTDAPLSVSGSKNLVSTIINSIK